MKRTNWPKKRNRFGRRRRQGSTSHQSAVNRHRLIQTTRQRAIQAGDAIISALKDEMHRGEHAYLETILEQCRYHADVVALSDVALALLRQDSPAAAAQKPEKPAIPTYGVSSWFLK